MPRPRPRAHWITIPLVVALGCGGSGGSGSAPPATTQLALTVAATTDVAAVSFTVAYDPSRVTLVGSGAEAECRLASSDALAVNDDDTGTLRVAIIGVDPVQRPTLALPTTLTCALATTDRSLTPADLHVDAKKIGVIDASGVVVAGDPSRLDVR